MKQTTASLKKILETKLNVPQKNIKRIKKYKSENGIVREFEINDPSRTSFVYALETDEDDEEIIGHFHVEDDSEEDEDEDEKPAKGSRPNKFANYYFAIATQKDDGFYLVSVIRKKFWDKYKHGDDQPCPIEQQLPSYISDLNESSDMAAYMDNWQDALTDLTKMGMEYNNDLAKDLDRHYPASKMYIKP